MGRDSPHPGVLLTAVRIDANDCLYPVAYAVVEVENKNSWKWFIEFLKYDLDIYEQKSWTFISDRQKGLGSAIQEVIPGVEHRHCVRHLHNNMKRLHPGETIKDRFWACARSSYLRMFETEMEALQNYDEHAHKWLVDNTHPSHWSRSHFRIAPKCDILLNNLCESFNSVILEAREKPILGLLENIRIYLMERLRTKREWMKKRSDAICPKIQKKLEKAKTEAARNIATFSDEKRFEVKHIHGGTYVVDLDNNTCTCRRWELIGLPCCHAVCCISLTGDNPEKYVYRYYSREAFLDAYEPAIGPISGPNAWKSVDKGPLLPPKKLRLPSRPKKARRRREPDEPRPNSKGVTRLFRVGQSTLSCSKCHEKGHTIRKCQLIIPPEQLFGHSSGKGPSFNSNKCSKCGVYGHNKRSCSKSTVKDQSAGEAKQNEEPIEEDVIKPIEVHHASDIVDKSDPTQDVASANAEELQAAEIIDTTPSAPEQLPEQKKKEAKCSICRASGHNRKTCPTHQAQSWRRRKATMDAYGLFERNRQNKKLIGSLMSRMMKRLELQLH